MLAQQCWRILAQLPLMTGVPGPRPTTPAEAIWLLGLLAIAFTLLVFANLAGEVVEGETLGFDRFVLLALRNPADLSDPIGPRWFDEMARDISSLGSNAILTGFTLAVTGYLALAAKRGAAVLVLASVGGGMAMSTLLKYGFSRPRPELVPHAVESIRPASQAGLPCSPQ